jgi:CxxC-x17-CxxC domain-containing protein
MKDFNKGGFRPDFKKKSWDNKGGGGFNKDFNKEDRQMHPATCSGCGKPCQVPFRPSAGKQVFCNDCFAKQRGEETFERRDPFQKDRGFKTDSRSDFRKDFKSDRGGFNDRNDRAPRFNPAPVAAPNMDGVIKQLQTMSMKLDTLMGMMNASKAPASAPAQASSETKTAKAPAPKAAEPKATKAAKAPKAEKPKKAAKKVSKKK